MVQIKLLVEGGAMQPGPALSQQIGPLGVNMGQVISKINDSTKQFKGIKLPVELSIDAETKEIKIKVFSPPVSELLKKELGLTKGSGEQKKLYSGNIAIEQVISVAKTKFPDMLCKDLNAAVKTVIGTCVSLGILVEGMRASEIEAEIDKGLFEKEIKLGKTDVSPEKKSQLAEKFNEIKTQQEKKVKAEAEAIAATAEVKPEEKAQAKPEEKAPEVVKKTAKKK
jgi:large subunit ribosomal protein L11